MVGADDEVSAAMMALIYRPLTNGTYYKQDHPVPFEGYSHSQAPIIMTDTKSAELIKHASECVSGDEDLLHQCEYSKYRGGSGSWISKRFARGIGSDSRIGSKFLNAGISYGGSCFPKDVQAFHVVARQVDTTSLAC